MPGYSLESVTVDGFRGLRNLRLDRLGLINILVGPNNCGKTSVLEALSILCNAADPSEWIWMVCRRDFGGLDETRVQSVRWCFRQSVPAPDADSMFGGECSMTCDGRFPLRKLRVTCEEIEGSRELSPFDRLEKEHSLVEQQGLGPLIDGPDLDLGPRRGALIKHFVESDGSLLRSGMSVPQPVSIRVWEDDVEPVGRVARQRSLRRPRPSPPYSYQINRIQARSFSHHLLGPKKNRVLDLVREFDPQIIDINLASFQGGRPAIYLDHQRLGQAPLSIFGDALRRAVLLAGTIPALQDGGVLLIDEIETGIHASKLSRVLGWLAKVARDLHVQVVATTHSLEAVDAIALATQDTAPDLVTFHLDQTDERTTVKRIDADLLSRLRRERALDVR